MKFSGGRATLLAVFAVAAVASTCSRVPEQQPMNTSSMDKFVFLTRQGCVNTVTMRERFDDALKAVGLPLQYQFIDADTLAPSDRRAGYGTPTVLYDGRDLFDMPEPPAPHPPPT